MDFLAKLTGRHEESARPAVFMQLEELVATMQAERQQLEKVLSAVRGDDGAAMPRALGKLEQRVSVLTQQLAAASSRTEQLERATATAEAFQTRMTTLEASLDRAEALTGETVQHAEEIRGERAALQELVSGAENTATRLEALLGDARLTQLSEQMPTLKDDCERACARQGSLTAELTQLRRHGWHDRAGGDGGQRDFEASERRGYWSRRTTRIRSTHARGCIAVRGREHSIPPSSCRPSTHSPSTSRSK